MKKNTVNTDLKDWRILLTGASSFIGASTIDYLEHTGASICNIDIAPPILSKHKKYWRQQDILDRSGLMQAFQDFQPTHLLHLAARTDLVENIPVSDYAANIEGVESVLNAARQCESMKKAMIVSTLYVCRPGYVPQADDDYCAHTVYGQSKVRTEEITRSADLPFPWCIVRPAVIWGPYHERLANEFFRIVRKGLYFHPGKTNAKKSYGYVENTVYQMIQLLAASGDAINKRTFYLADPPESVYRWADVISRQLIGKPIRRVPLWIFKLLALTGDCLAKIGYDKFPMTSFRLWNMTHDSVIDTGPVELIVGQVPYSLEEGAERTMSWLREREESLG